MARMYSMVLAIRNAEVTGLGVSAGLIRNEGDVTACLDVHAAHGVVGVQRLHHAGNRHLEVTRVDDVEAVGKYGRAAATGVGLATSIEALDDPQAFLRDLRR